MMPIIKLGEGRKKRDDPDSLPTKLSPLCCTNIDSRGWRPFPQHLIENRKILTTVFPSFSLQVKVWFQNRRTKHKRMQQEEGKSGESSDQNRSTSSPASGGSCPEDDEDEFIDMDDCPSDEENMHHNGWGSNKTLLSSYAAELVNVQRSKLCQID